MTEAIQQHPSSAVLGIDSEDSYSQDGDIFRKAEVSQTFKDKLDDCIQSRRADRAISFAQCDDS